MSRLFLLTAAFFVMAFLRPALAGDEDPVLAAVDEIAREVEEIRGLKFKTPVKREMITPAEIAAVIREMIAAEIPPEKLAGINLLLGRLGLLPPGLKLEDCFAEFMEAGVAGLYRPDKKTLYIVKGYSPRGARPIIFHELVHALEDQHYDLEERMRRYMHDSDRAAGVQGLVEGSAQHMMGKYLRKHPELMAAMMADVQKNAMQQARMLARVPTSLVVGSAIYPYYNGPAFIYRATEDDPARIADLFAKMPVSTEQVLHPEKYGEDGDYPVTVRIPGLPTVGGFTRLHEDSVGELQMGLLLNELSEGNPQAKLLRVMNAKQQVEFRGVVKDAVTGWDGDWIVGYRGPAGQCGFLWASSWDSEKDAREFLDGYRQALPFKWFNLGIAPATARLEQRGNRVLVVEGFAMDDLKSIAAAAWKAATFTVDPRDKNDVAATSKD